MSVIRKIKANIAQMSPADKAIGTYIIENVDDIFELSSTQLAEKVGRSQSSVVKFTQRIGYTTYQDLKIALSATRAHRLSTPETMLHGTIGKNDGLRTIFEKLLTSKYRTIRETVTSNSPSALENAVGMLHMERRIFLTGVGASSLVVFDLTFKLQKIGRNVIQNSDSHIMMANVANMNTEDVLLAISYSGKSTETLKISTVAQERGAKIIAMTGLQNNPLAKMADLILHTVADDDNVRSSSITARDAQLALTDLLFLAVLQKQADASEYIKRSEQAVSALKVT